MHTIKQVNEITGISKAALRFYDDEKIICAKRQENDYRVYDKIDILHLKYLSLLKYAGFTLPEIKALINALNAEYSEECHERCTNIISTGILKLQKTVDSYNKILNLLSQAIPLIENFDDGEEKKLEMDNFIEKLYKDIIKGE